VRRVFLALTSYFIFFISLNTVLQLTVVLGTTTVKDTLISMARSRLGTSPVPYNIKTLGKRVPAQSTIIVV
jgi:type III secretory pathway component EscR